MKIVCEILTADPDGGAARISFEVFKTLYRFAYFLLEDSVGLFVCVEIFAFFIRFLASIDGNISEETQMAALDFLKRESYGFDLLLNYSKYSLIYCIMYNSS